MLRKVGAYVILVAVSTTSSWAANLPEIMSGPGNAVPQCVTPGRLMAFLRMRNPGLNPRYDSIATQYMRYGEQLGVRWDFAFYQMIIETGALRYTGDVRPEQNNFAGLAATGRGERGESFRDIETGVRAHIEHVLLYAGHPVANPVAERTRKVHEWGTLDSWRQSFTRPITFADLGTKWSGNRTYTSMLQAVAEHFQSDVCHSPDPRPELVREARALIGAGSQTAQADAAAADQAPAGQAAAGQKMAEAGAVPSVLAIGAELVQRVLDPKPDPNEGRSALGAPKTAAEPAVAPSTTYPSTPYKVINAPAADATAPAASTSAPAATRTASAAASAGPKTRSLTDTAVPPAANQKCRVWTASYGGQKAIIIRSLVDQVVNFTVLDVNDGAESREVDAFIAAYAKNGKITGEYPNQAQALDKAFELCPEG